MLVINFIDRIKFRLFRWLLSDLLHYRPCGACNLEEFCGQKCTADFGCIDIYEFLVDMGERVWLEEDE